MKKNLNVDAMILDLRNVQEDFLDRYEQIKLDCMIALTSPRVQTLLSQQVCALCGDDSITQHIETGAIPAQGRGGQFQVVLHHGGAVRHDDQLGGIREERGQNGRKACAQDGLWSGKAAALCGQCGSVEPGVNRQEAMFIPVQAALCPQQEGVV